ncbi:unnamed protein product [Rotaria sp. Silwood2]|nr:unnamed protein product [Rotaria sp. Silwood2]CAF3459490.1 unnamed protein product [Rotaria sp. Silwood2]CAF4396267.1 unnamed protein product [Rotaria sp. Silwood2]CAF4430178.1 unnamed protein product [Rotaria sp. Silwood2]
MQIQLNSISLIFACLLIFICFTINNKVNAGALRRNIHDAAIQNMELPQLALRKKRDTLGELDDNDNNAFQQDERYLDGEADVDGRKTHDNDVSASTEEDNPVLKSLNHSDEDDDLRSLDNSDNGETGLEEDFD